MTLVECIKAIQSGKAKKFAFSTVEYTVSDNDKVVRVDEDGGHESYDIHKTSFLTSDAFYLVEEEDIPKGYTKRDSDGKYVRTLIYDRYLVMEPFDGGFVTHIGPPLRRKSYHIMMPIEVEYPD